MARFNATLEQQITPETGVVAPTSAETFAGIGRTLASGVSNFMQSMSETQAERELKDVDSKVEELLRLEQDLQATNPNDRVKVRRRIEEEIRNSFDDPAKVLSLRGRLAGFRGGFVNQEVRSDQLSVSEQRTRQADELYSAVPTEYKAMLLGGAVDDGLVTEDEKLKVWQEYSSIVNQQAQAVQQKNAVLAQQGKVSVQQINEFHQGALNQRSGVLTQATRNFFGQIQQIDLNSPEGTVEFQNAKSSALQAAAVVEQQILDDYDQLITKLDDTDAIKLAEKKRDSALEPIVRLRTQIQSDDLDVLKSRANVYNGLILDQKLPYVESIAQMNVLTDLYGTEFVSVMGQSAFNRNPALQDLVYDRVTGAFNATKLQESTQSSDMMGVYSSQEQFQALYGNASQAASKVRGLTDPVSTDRLAKEYVKAANFGGTGGLAVSDLMILEKDYIKFSNFWNQLPEQEKGLVEQAYKKVKQQILLDPQDGLVAATLESGIAEFKGGKFVYKRPSGGMQSISTPVVMPGVDFTAVQQLEESKQKQRVQELNRRLDEVKQNIKAENPELSDEEILQLLRLQ